ncbi:MAG: ATP-dependent helicase [Pseudomonadota bacterium]
MHNLNDHQKAAAAFMFGTASVVAIAGSGKTATMAARIGNLVSQGIPPEKILGLTFTRNAAGAMRNKLRPVLLDQSSKVTLSTIHSFCHRLLKEEGRTFEMLHGKRQVYLMRKVIKRLDVGEFSAGFALREIGLAKSRLMDWERFRSFHENDEVMQAVAEIYQVYEEEKRKCLCLDFSDLLMEAYRLLKSHEDRCNSYRQTFPHILVDEYQDTNPAQVEVLNLIAGKNDYSSLWVCGDDWQSIFGFTGAEVENILSFSKRHPGSVRFILDTNYRSTPQILTACQHLISHNKRKIDKTLNTINQPGESIIVLHALSEDEEARQIETEIRDLVESRGYAYRDIAILYRANSQSRAIEEAFSKRNVPYRIESEANFYNRYEVNILIQYLVLVNEPDTFDGDEALKTVINVPGRYVSHSFIENLETYAEANDLHLYPALKVIPVGAKYLKDSIEAFTSLIDSLASAKTWLEPAGLIEQIREQLDLDKYLADELSDPFEGPLESLDQLQRASGPYEDLGEFLEYAESVRTNSGKDEEGVTLSTVHKAKGLEFPVVFVIGMVEGVMPNANGEPEEERRIAFVAMSRAMRLLYLSQTMSYLGRPAKPSSFIAEAFKRKEVVEK